MKKIIATPNAPEAIGPYSQATQLGNLLFVSGQLPLDPKSMEIVVGGIVEQTTQSLKNIKAIAEAAGSSMEKCLKVTALMVDLGQFNDMNEVYKTFFTSKYPARACYQIVKLPRNALIEFEAIFEI